MNLNEELTSLAINPDAPVPDLAPPQADHMFPVVSPGSNSGASLQPKPLTLALCQAAPEAVAQPGAWSPVSFAGSSPISVDSNDASWDSFSEASPLPVKLSEDDAQDPASPGREGTPGNTGSDGSNGGSDAEDSGVFLSRSPCQYGSLHSPPSIPDALAGENIPVWRRRTSYHTLIWPPKPNVVPFSKCDKCGGFEQNCDCEDADRKPTRSVQFRPPICEQRYLAVINRVQMHSGICKKLVDLGSHQLNFLKEVFSKCPLVEQVVGVDIDRKVLEGPAHFLATMGPGVLLSLLPRLITFLAKLTYEHYFSIRKTALRLDVYQGNIFLPDSRLADADLITAIEVIEHLQPEDIPRFESAIFGTMRPFCVVITTPNAEFNPVFGLAQGKFRHDDHKFEWTRQQFMDWVEGVVRQYPAYSFEYEGIGCGWKEQTHQFGNVSQMAVFTRHTPDTSEHGLEADRAARRAAALENPSHEYELLQSASYASYESFEVRSTAAIDLITRFCKEWWDKWLHTDAFDYDATAGIAKLKLSALERVEGMPELIAGDKNFLREVLDSQPPPWLSEFGALSLETADGRASVCDADHVIFKTREDGNDYE